MLSNCPLCGGKAGKSSFPYSKKWNGKQFNYCKCIACQSTFIDPMPDAADFELIYSKSAYHDVHYSNVAFSAAQQSIARVLPGLKVGLTMLDFGCGNGGFLVAAKEAGFVCTGVEYEKSAREAASTNSGCPVSSLDELIKTNAKFDVIHLGDVLEHLPNPAEMIILLSKLLSAEGKFYIEGPLETNPSVVRWAVVLFASIKKMLGRDLPGTTPPTHLFMTNAKAQLEFFARRMGYQSIAYFIYETGWPYLNTGHKDHGLGSVLIKRPVGRVAVMASYLFPVLGNRFIGLFQPKSVS